MVKNNSKKEILKAAMKIFVVNGYSDTKMDDIALGAGLSKGAVYHHFNSKNELFLSLIDFFIISVRVLICSLLKRVCLVIKFDYRLGGWVTKRSRY